MASFCLKIMEKTVDPTLPLLLIDADEEELALSYMEEELKEMSNRKTVNFHLRDVPDSVCIQQFRFCKEEIYRLCHLLRIPDPVICSTGIRVSASFALCPTLRRLAYPNRWCDLTLLFGRSISQLSLIFKEVSNLIIDNFGHKLSSLDQAWIDPERFAQAVADKGAPLNNCWGLIDGTAREMTRPSEDQRHVFSGHKRKHVLKFQSIMAPNGLVVNLSGPYAGRRHDSGMLADSGLLPLLQERMNDAQGDAFCLYGDPAYPQSYHLQAPFRSVHLTAEEQLFNKDMSSVRQCVEWGFGKVTTLFAFVDFRKNLKLFLQPIGKYYILAHLLANCHTCLNGSQTSTYFSLDPPSLEQYLS
ncbi:hypothetical protein BaRGS_00027571 [Batillaria attramentaria]|uniref:DDE Tnp4 domain-containing protein n=1 Tax=Batillaria attramentaria TaxID=370345 RepID=A0ABD0K2Q6_9CAEN